MMDDQESLVTDIELHSGHDLVYDLGRQAKTAMTLSWRIEVRVLGARNLVGHTSSSVLR